MVEIKKIPGYFISKIGEVISKRNKTPIKHYNNHAGYKFVVVHINNTIKRFSLHRLLAEAFIPNPENKPMINHINGVKTDNRLENLEWVTAKENCQHAWDTGLRFPIDVSGIKNPNSILTNEDVIAIHYFLTKSIKVNILMKKYKVSKSTIMSIKTGTQWKNLNLPIITEGRASSVSIKMIKEVEKLLLNTTIREINRKLGYSRQVIKKIKDGKYKEMQDIMQTEFSEYC